MHHQIKTPDAGWHPAEEISVDYGYFNWPLSPCLGTGSDGTVHALWFQETSTPELEPHQRNLEYRTGKYGVWTNPGDFLAGQSGGPLGSRVALDVSPADAPVLAWTRRDTVAGQPQPQQVWIARQGAPSAAPDEEIPRPESALRAWPNPFNPVVHLEFDLPSAGVARLEIFDARGRRLSRLVDGTRAAGLNTATWNGKDAADQNQPSGIYFARLTSASGTMVQKLILAR